MWGGISQRSPASFTLLPTVHFRQPFPQPKAKVMPVLTFDRHFHPIWRFNDVRIFRTRSSSSNWQSILIMDDKTVPSHPLELDDAAGDTTLPASTSGVDHSHLLTGKRLVVAFASMLLALFRMFHQHDQSHTSSS